MKRIALLLLFAVILTSRFSFSQTDTFKFVNKFSISIMPQVLFINGIRIDLEVPIDKTNSFIASPEFYSKGGKVEDHYTILGAGLKLQLRHYININSPDFIPFCSFIGGFEYFEIDDIENNLPTTTKISKGTVDLLIGTRNFLSPNFPIDIFIGYGLRLPSFDYSGSAQNRYDKNWYMYGYQGNILIVGFTLGIIP